ncbi:hypothetical protein GCU60_19315 [Blastococcus saxobsidens]|uniref:PpiC domain-containing protein n=1 Tax=Blastococcus saxobsidens TaxID=138336 RepID=A0A6L9W8L3_9ACTN|nr:hypothetical protein [Blastococcus saxobsidens]NEK87894.1 hypothetical protein [Blastococcus saxobsidens]
MLSRSPLAVGACLVVVLTTGCGQRGPDAPASGSTLATVGDAAVSADEVMALFDPTGQDLPVRIAAGAAGGPGDEDPLEQALRAAIDDELLAHEAERQGVEGVHPAQRRSRLLDEHVRSRIGEFDEGELRGWYDDHRYLFDHVETADVRYVVLDSAAALDAVVAGLEDAETDPDALVEEYSAVEGGRLTMSHEGPEPPLMVERIVNAAKHRGVVSYDMDPATGHWWVVGIEDIALEPSPWTPELATKVEEAMRWAAEQELIASWTRSLEEEWPVIVHQENVERFERSLRGE